MTSATKHLYSLEPAWDDQHNYPFHIIDQPDMLFGCDGDLDKPQPLRHQWSFIELVVHEFRLPADIYFTLGDAFFFSPIAQACVAAAMGDDVEWLPVSIRGLGAFHLLHPLREAPLAADACVEINPVSRNITEIRNYRFRSADLDCLRVFMPAQPPGSAAARSGFSFGQVMVTDIVQRCFVESGLVGVICHERSLLTA